MPDTNVASDNTLGIAAAGVVWSIDVPASGDTPGWTWSHLDLVNGQSRVDVGADEYWPPAVRRLLTGQDETPRVVVHDNVVCGVLPSYPRDGGADDYELVYWRFAATADRVTTLRRHPARSVAAGYHASTGSSPPREPSGLIFACIADFSRAARVRLTTLSDELDAIEDKLLDHNASGINATTAGLIGQIRREAIVVKRALTPVSRTLDESEEELPALWHGPELDPTHSAVMGVLDDIAALNERARSLQDELSSRLADETNRRLYIVSLVTTLVIPATFVTGFFGMNTGGLLWSGEDAHFGTVYAGITCIAAVLLMLAVMKRKRLL